MQCRSFQWSLLLCGLLALPAGVLAADGLVCDDSSGGKAMVLSPVQAAVDAVKEYSEYDYVVGKSFCYVTRPNLTSRGPGLINRDGAYWFFYGDVPSRGKIVGIYSPAWPNVWTEVVKEEWKSRKLENVDYCTRWVAVTLYPARFMKVELTGVPPTLKDKVKIQGIRAEYMADRDEVINCDAVPWGFVMANTPLVFKIPLNDKLVASVNLVVRFEVRPALQLEYEYSLKDLIANETLPLSMARAPDTAGGQSAVERQLRQATAGDLQGVSLRRTIMDRYEQ